MTACARSSSISSSRPPSAKCVTAVGVLAATIAASSAEILPVPSSSAPVLVASRIDVPGRPTSHESDQKYASGGRSCLQKMPRGGSSAEATTTTTTTEEITEEEKQSTNTHPMSNPTARNKSSTSSGEKRKKKKRSSSSTSKSNKYHVNNEEDEDGGSEIGGVHRGGGVKEATMHKTSSKSSKSHQTPSQNDSADNISPGNSAKSETTTHTTQHNADTRTNNGSSTNNPKTTQTQPTQPSHNNNNNNNDNKSPQHNPQSQLPPAAQSILRQKCYYDILGITKQATQVEIQKAYRRRCVLTHPDKIPSGDRSAFDKVSEAYDVLSCEKKRALYDRFGKEGVENGGFPGGMGGFGGGGGSTFFGNDVFRDFFGFSTGSGNTDPFFGRYRSSSSSPGSSSPSSSSSFRRPPRNRDLRYQLEVTLEDLYTGSTKLVAIQQPNPLRPQFPLRKEVEVTLCPGMSSGESVRLAGVVDSIPDAAPADVVFLLSQRRHSVFTRRGYDLAMECKISLGEALVGFKKKILHLDGREVWIASPRVGDAVAKELHSSDGSKTTDHQGKQINDHATAGQVGAEAAPAKETIELPSVVVQTGDVHVLKGEGMPKKRSGAHGDLYIQYVVEMPGSNNSKLQSSNLNDEERIELARLLRKLEGVDDSDKSDPGITNDNNDKNTPVHYLSVASASDFGRSSDTDDNTHDEHLRHDDEENNMQSHGFRDSEDINDFFQRAFTGRPHGFGGGGGGPFGVGRSSSGNGGTFHYFSSSGGSGFGSSPFFNGRQGMDDDHKVECNQM